MSLQTYISGNCIYSVNISVNNNVRLDYNQTICKMMYNKLLLMLTGELSWTPGVKYKCNLLLYINYTHVVHMLQNIQTILIQFVIKNYWHHSKSWQGFGSVSLDLFKVSQASMTSLLLQLQGGGFST